MSDASIHSFFDKQTFTATHLVWCPRSLQALVIDSVLDFDQKAGRTSTSHADELIDFIRSRDLKLAWLLETHAHADHFSAAPYLKQALGGQVAIGRRIDEVQQVFSRIFNAPDIAADGAWFDHLFEDGETFRLGDLEVGVMHTPGHTPACVSYRIGADVFVGDTLFMPDYGSARCDFPGGDARTLYRSIRKLLDLPPDTRLHLCHDYLPGGREACWQTTVAEQRRANLHVHDGVTEDEFVAMRAARDKTLGMPALMLPSVQVNLRGGRMPPAEANGTRYLKIPLDVF